jgi:hypothetical protein
MAGQPAIRIFHYLDANWTVKGRNLYSRHVLDALEVAGKERRAYNEVGQLLNIEERMGGCHKGACTLCHQQAHCGGWLWKSECW